jgi:hypothetical protein
MSPGSSVSPHFIGNYRIPLNHTKPTMFLRPKVWTSVVDFMTNLGYIGNPTGFSGFSRFTLIDPDEKSSTGTIRLTYPAGVGVSSGIAGMYSYPGWPYTNVSRMTLEYDIFFPTGFTFVREGKLPGIWGMNGLKSTFDCGGGASAVANNCFSMRLLWRNSTGAGAACNDP